MKYRFPPIRGENIGGHAFPNYVWNADLIYFDGPFLSLYTKENGGDAFFFWLDTDGKKHRWAVVDVARSQLVEYLNAELSLQAILDSVESLFVFESTATGRRSNIKLLKPAALPSSYRPKSQSFLTERIASAAAIALRDETTKRFELQFTGEEFFIEDLSRIPRLYEQLYSFIYGLTHIDRLAVREKVVSATKDWTGGFSAVRLFSGLRAVTPTIHRARVADMYMASPGEIGMQLLPAMAKKIAESVEALGQHAVSADQRYRDCYAYFKEHGLGGFEDVDERRGENLTVTQQGDIQNFVGAFLDEMGLKEIAPAFSALEVDALGQLRALLAYYRRLRKLRGYVDDGILKVPKRSSTKPPLRDRTI